MWPTHFLPRPELLLTSLASVSLFGAVAYAADSSASDAAKSTDSSNDSSSNDSKSTDNGDTATQTTADSAKETTTEEKTSTTAEAASTTAEAESTTSEAVSTTSEDATSTTDSSDSSTTDIESTISSVSSASDTESALTGMPTLTGVYAIPTYPAPSVPPTNNAPFMQHSSAPDGTVFIAVGAILGAFAIGILLWRAIIGFCLHRSVERAAKAQHDANVKTGFPAPPAPFYKYTDNTSTMSLSAGRGVRRTTRGPILSSTPSASNLFFSPTATAAASGGAGGNRASAFLPSGFYAAGSSSPGGNHEHSISLTNLRPDSRGQFGNPSRNTLSATPPDSPSFNARRDVSNTSLNLTRPPSQRAPSAFLDDLLADDPSALPPPHMPGSQRHSSSHSNSVPGSQNRF